MILDRNPIHYVQQVAKCNVEVVVKVPPPPEELDRRYTKDGSM